MPVRKRWLKTLPAVSPPLKNDAEPLARRRVGQGGQLGVVAQPALEDGRHRRLQVGDPAKRAEHPDDGFLELGRTVQAAHAVAQQHDGGLGG